LPTPIPKPIVRVKEIIFEYFFICKPFILF
jgi:hypothetical protein